MQAINYISDIECQPLATQLELVKKQINHFARLSKKKLSYEEKKALVEAWQSTNKLRASIYSRIQNIEKNFSNN